MKRFLIFLVAVSLLDIVALPASNVEAGDNKIRCEFTWKDNPKFNVKAGLISVGKEVRYLLQKGW